MKSSARRRTTALNHDDQSERIATLEAQLERARQEMRAFSYSVSHDLRAPLRAIEGFARILAEDYGAKLDEEGQRFIQHVVNNAQVMGSLVEDLLAFHRLGERKLEPASVDMAQFTREILSTSNASEPAVKVKLGELPTVKADPTLLRTGWEHLILNALKFSKRRTPAEIEIGSRAENGETIFWVRDNGIGFDMKYGDKLFQVFQKLQKEPDFPGNGIGLAMVRRVMDKHNGRAWAEAEPEKGATFFIALPQG